MKDNYKKTLLIKHHINLNANQFTVSASLSLIKSSGSLKMTGYWQNSRNFTFWLCSLSLSAFIALLSLFMHYHGLFCFTSLDASF